MLLKRTEKLEHQGAAILLAFAVLFGTATGARAAGSVDAPENCQPFLTVQMKSCQVSVFWRCSDAPEGMLWESSYDQDGQLAVSIYDSEFQWVSTQYPFDGSQSFLLEAGPDPISMTDLLETGEDTYDFTTRDVSDMGTQDIRHVGVDSLTGETVTIDGVDLLVADVGAQAINVNTGQSIYVTSGRQYILASERLFLLGEDRHETGGEVVEDDFSPIDFLFPGDPGFGKTKPLYECGEQDL